MIQNPAIQGGGGNEIFDGIGKSIYEIAIAGAACERMMACVYVNIPPNAPDKNQYLLGCGQLMTSNGGFKLMEVKTPSKGSDHSWNLYFESQYIEVFCNGTLKRYDIDCMDGKIIATDGGTDVISIEVMSFKM